MHGLLLKVLSWIHVLVLTFCCKLKAFVFVRDVIMNQTINLFLMLSQNLQNHSLKVKGLFQHLQYWLAGLFLGRCGNQFSYNSSNFMMFHCVQLGWVELQAGYSYILNNTAFRVQLCLQAVSFDSCNCTCLIGDLKTQACLPDSLVSLL